MLSGRVLDADGHAVADAQVALALPMRWDGKGAGTRLVHSDETGAFRVPDVAPGEYGVSATAGAGFGAHAGIIELGTKPRNGVILKLEKEGFVVSGVVRDDAGAPVTGARLEAIEVPRDQIVYATEADREGRYALSLPGETPFLIVVSAGARARTYERVSPVNQQLDVIIGPEPAPRPTDEVLRAWLANGAVEITTDDPTAPLDDLEPVTAMVGNARLVGLGEATHGSHEIFLMKHRLVLALVEKQQFTVLGLESGYADTLAFDAYVQGGPGDVTKVVRGLVTTPFETHEMIALAKALRAHNAKHPNSVSVVGIDCVSARSALALPDYFELAGSPDPDLVEALKPLATYEADGMYASEPEAVQRRCRAAIDRCLEVLDRDKSTLVAATSPKAWRVARRHAEMLDQAERSYRDPTLRDTLMAKNAAALVDAPSTKAILWAHNAHVNAEAVLLNDMGRRLRRQLGKDYVVVATAFGRGGVRASAMSNMSGGPQNFEVGGPAPSGLDHALGLHAKPLFAIDLRNAPDEVARWLASPMPVWSIGSAFSDDAGARFDIAPGRAFDVVVYLDRVTHAQGLPR